MGKSEPHYKSINFACRFTRVEYARVTYTPAHLFAMILLVTCSFARYRLSWWCGKISKIPRAVHSKTIGTPIHTTIFSSLVGRQENVSNLWDTSLRGSLQEKPPCKGGVNPPWAYRHANVYVWPANNNYCEDFLVFYKIVCYWYQLTV